MKKNLRSENEKQENMRLSSVKSKKLSHKLLSVLCHQKKFFFFYIYKMCTFSVNTWGKNNIEAVKYNGKKWINEKHLEIATGYKN